MMMLPIPLNSAVAEVGVPITKEPTPELTSWKAPSVDAVDAYRTEIDGWIEYSYFRKCPFAEDEQGISCQKHCPSKSGCPQMRTTESGVKLMAMDVVSFAGTRTSARLLERKGLKVQPKLTVWGQAQLVDDDHRKSARRESTVVGGK